MTAGRRTRGMCSRVFVSQERATVAEPTYLAPGVVLQDRYEIADEIGRGGFSIVYRARDRRVGADVAIKLLALDGRARLTDFGSARLSGQETVTQTGGLVGTADYAAPEQLAGGRGDARADEYALGVTLYYALTGELPARVPSRGGGDAGRDGHRPRRRHPEVPVWLDHVVGRATMPDPDDRFPAIAFVADALERGAEGVEGGAAPAPADKARCVLCRAPEPFGIGVCPRCARRAAGGDDVLVFLEWTTPGSARRAVRETLEERIGTGVSAAGRDSAAAGQRPLLRVPAEAGARVVELLEVQGLSARTESRIASWRAAVPPPIMMLAGVVAATGAAAAFVAATPVLLVTSPAVAVGLMTLAVALGRTPVWNPPSSRRSTLPADGERAAVRALAALPTGAARALLIDLLRRADAVTT